MHKNIENNNKKNYKIFVQAGGIDHRLYSAISTGGGQCQPPASRKHFYRRWSM